MDRLNGKTALISGGARGIGAAIAERFLEEGAKVVIGDILDQDGRKLQDRLGKHLRYIPLDVTKPSDWDRAVGEAVEAFGCLNILVNNAGIVDFGRIDAYAHDRWTRIIDVNLTGVFNGIRAAVADLATAGSSSIINISSIAGLRGYEQLCGYTASKFGVRGLTKSAALDLGGYGIRVNSVHPGVIETPMTAGMVFDTAPVPLHRTGQPMEVANLAVYLAADESSFVTGAEFVIDGGETAGTVAPSTK
ncbi:glucose 1-dehydrogenase [Paeniglutamicibacter psychrophenolicus]|uniref:glucose 1-dehydrogenase n=1 Tax=Paeniglutamicibacter psychrophenolicus TaxID=257454 RepID=UPI00278A95C1|nr:glucose 1-dehydrogenase [Paeniglutamicibacter psychrophenolicus]MDQ0092500.1 3alpha(or 20beta)-hydroxysteroid dehydrogenase [Paeniglutamicibacter psychrophenolicus]